MRLKNTCTLFDDDLVRRVIAFVKPSGVAGFNVNVKNSGSPGACGRAYVSGCSHGSNGGRVLVVCRLGKTVFPYRYEPRRGGYLPWRVFSYEELLVHIMAHELRHHWQTLVPRGWRVWGARGRYSERDADAYAIRMVRAWRRR